MTVGIRPERPGDADAIAALVESAFGSRVEAELVAALRHDASYRPEQSLVADDAGTIVGHVMVTTAWVVHGDDRHVVGCLAPLAVAPDRQRHGIGSALVSAVVAAADAAGDPLVALQGNPLYYGRLGFESADARGVHMDLPSWAPREAAQVMVLSGYTPSVRGELELAAPFGALPEE